MVDKEQVQLGPVQQTLLITLHARAVETRKRHPVLRDPKAAEIVDAIDFDSDKYGQNAGGAVTVLRTALFDRWVRTFLADHPNGTVVELGCGLNTRFERVDNGSLQWVDVDLPDTIDLRRKFFSDSGRRTMIASSVLDDEWQDAVAQRPGPYFFVAEGVFVYLDEADVVRMLSGLANRFPGSFTTFDTYSRHMMEQQHKMADRKNIPARWAWSCDDPATLADRIGMRVVDGTSVTHPPADIRSQLPLGFRLTLPVIDKIVRGFAGLTLFRAKSF